MTFDDTPGEFFVSTDKALLDTFFVIKELQGTYWGAWLTPPTVIRAIDHSLCFGLYRRETKDGATVNQQIGFARVITDYATFAWVCDVVITESFRKQGLGKFLMSIVVGHPDVKPRSSLLVTKDQQHLYTKFGFKPVTAMKRMGGTL